MVSNDRKNLPFLAGDRSTPFETPRRDRFSLLVIGRSRFCLNNLDAESAIANNKHL